MNEFINKYSKLSFSQAVSNVINTHDGSKLIIASGYISNAKEVSELAQQLHCALKRNPRLHLEVYMGIFSKNPENDIIKIFKKHLPRGSISLGVASRVTVYGIWDFHAKFTLMIDQNLKGISGTIGSSNLSARTLKPKSRAEYDLYMRGGESNVLLQSFSEETLSFLAKEKLRSAKNVTKKIRKRIYELPLIAYIDGQEEETRKIQKMEEIDTARKQELDLHDFN